MHDDGRMPLLDLYHRTDAASAARIVAEGRMTSLENTGEAYFSDRPDGQTEGYGSVVVHVRVPEDLASLEDEFPDGEQHYRVAVGALRPEHFVGLHGDA